MYCCGSRSLKVIVEAPRTFIKQRIEPSPLATPASWHAGAAEAPALFSTQDLAWAQYYITKGVY